MAAKAGINLQCKLVSSFLKEDKGKADAVVVTKFSGEAVKGLFRNFSKQLEEMVFETGCWSKITTGTVEDRWVMRMKDSRTDEQFVEIKNTIIKDMVVKVGKENVLEVAVAIQHGQTKQQPSLESAISTTVLLQLEKDTEILEGMADDEEQEAAGKTSK